MAGVRGGGGGGGGGASDIDRPTMPLDTWPTIEGAKNGVYRRALMTSARDYSRRHYDANVDL